MANKDDPTQAPTSMENANHHIPDRENTSSQDHQAPGRLEFQRVNAWPGAEFYGALYVGGRSPLRIWSVGEMLTYNQSSRSHTVLLSREDQDSEAASCRLPNEFLLLKVFKIVDITITHVKADRGSPFPIPTLHLPHGTAVQRSNAAIFEYRFPRFWESIVLPTNLIGRIPDIHEPFLMTHGLPARFRPNTMNMNDVKDFEEILVHHLLHNEPLRKPGSRVDLKGWQLKRTNDANLLEPADGPWNDIRRAFDVLSQGISDSDLTNVSLDFIPVTRSTPLGMYVDLKSAATRECTILLKVSHMDKIDHTTTPANSAQENLTTDTLPDGGGSEDSFWGFIMFIDHKERYIHTIPSDKTNVDWDLDPSAVLTPSEEIAPYYEALEDKWFGRVYKRIILPYFTAKHKPGVGEVVDEPPTNDPATTEEKKE